MDDRTYNTKEASGYTGLSTVLLHRLAKRGQLPSTRAESRPGKMYAETDLDGLFVPDAEFGTAVAVGQDAEVPDPTTLGEEDGIKQAYFSLAQAARYTGLAAYSLQRLTRRRELPMLRLPDVEGRFYRRADLNRLLAPTNAGAEADNSAERHGTAGLPIRRGRGRQRKT